MRYSEPALQKVREERFLIQQVDQWLYELMKPYFGQRVLEVGCGMGTFVRHLTDRQLYVGTDVSEECVAHVKEIFSGCKNVEVRFADVTKPTFREMSCFQVDTIFSVNVLEHIEDDTAALRNVAHVLPVDGVVILVVPAHARLYGSMDRSIGHYRRYNRDRMSDLIQRAGLQCYKQRYINLVGAVGWFVNGRILRRETPPAGQLRVFNRLTPALKRIESAIPPPVGLSLMAVAHKKPG